MQITEYIVNNNPKGSVKDSDRMARRSSKYAGLEI